MRVGASRAAHFIMIGLAIASTVAVALTPVQACAQSAADSRDRFRASSGAGSGANQETKPRHARGGPRGRAASDPASRGAIPADLDQRRRDGHMTPEERRLLRQHIEDAVHDLYKR